MKEAWESSRRIIISVLIGIFIIGAVNLIFNDSISNDIIVYFLIFLGISIPTIILLHNYLLNKKRIDWKHHKDLEYISKLLCITSCIFISEIFYSSNHGLKSSIFFSVLSIFSVWTYLSWILGGTKALFLLRSFLATLIVLLWLAVVIITSFPQNIENTLMCLFIICQIALCVKGLIISFRKDCIKTFPMQEASFLDILLVSIIIYLFFALKSVEINDLDILFNTSKYPLLQK